MELDFLALVVTNQLAWLEYSLLELDKLSLEEQLELSLGNLSS